MPITIHQRLRSLHVSPRIGGNWGFDVCIRELLALLMDADCRCAQGALKNGSLDQKALSKLPQALLWSAREGRKGPRTSPNEYLRIESRNDVGSRIHD